jgi:hypothetical protein
MSRKGAVAATLVLCLWVPRALADEVLANAAFEKTQHVLGKNIPLGWSKGESVDAAVLTEDGQRFCRLTSGSKSDTAMVWQRVKLEPDWKLLRLEARVRVKQIEPGERAWEGARLFNQFEGEKGERVGDYPAIPVVRQPGDWLTLRVTQPTRADAGFYRVSPGLQGAAGIVDVQWVRLTPFTDAAGAMVPLAESKKPGSFEEFDPGDLPTGWDRLDGSVTVEREGDSAFLRVVASTPQATSSCRLLVRLPEGTRKLRVEGRLRTKDFKRGEKQWEDARIDLQFLDDGLQRVGPYVGVPSVREETTEWKTVSVKLDVPDGATALGVSPKLLNATGTLDVDDIVIEVVP